MMYGPRGTTRNTRFILVTGLALFVAMSQMAWAWAHSTKEGTVPADGASVNGSPPTIELRFDGPMRITMMTLTDDSGQSFALSRDKSLAARANHTATPTTLPPGTYRVEWRGLAEDGHAMQGGFAFTVE